MIYKTPSGQEIELKPKDTQTARFKRDSYFLAGDYNQSLVKYPDNHFHAFADFVYPELLDKGKPTGEIGCRYKEVFELFLEGELDKVDYSLDNDNEKQLRDIAMGVMLDFFGQKRASTST